jgi:hygromycin-B 4-O-kinase
MSIHKTQIDQGVVLDFLKSTFTVEVLNFEVIRGGEGSQAYSFNVDGKYYVVRINKHTTEGFRKDEYASVNFGSWVIPVPRVFKIGKMENGMSFCISEKAEGKILDAYKGEEFNGIIPALYEVADAIHGIDVANTKGFGKWDMTGNGTKVSWKEHILSVDCYAKGEDGKPGLFETTFLEKDFWDIAYSKMIEYLPYCPEERYLVHGDYGFNNVLSDGKNITGVIDWEHSMFGDFLFDIAWLAFWSSNWPVYPDFEGAYLKYITEKNLKIENFRERMLCYKLFIGLGSLSFSAYSDQREKYDKNKKRIEAVLALS